MDTEDQQIKNFVVAFDDTILEAEKTGITIECENTGKVLHVFSFHVFNSTDENQGLSGVTVAENYQHLTKLFEEGRFTPVSNFKPSTLHQERYQRAQLCGQQGLEMTAEMSSDYSLIGTYLQGINESIAHSHNDMKELIARHGGDHRKAAATKEYHDIASESERLDSLQDRALQMRDSIMRDSKAYNLGYHICEVEQALLESDTQTQNYLLGLYVRQQELQKALQHNMNNRDHYYANQLELIDNRHEQLGQLSEELGLTQRQPVELQEPAKPSARTSAPSMG